MLKARTGAGEEKLSAAEARRLVHELRVHELELEMQNEELRRAHDVLEESRSKYSDLYDFAPVGYLTLDPKGRILEANLTACAQLGVERSFLIEKPLYVHVAADEGSRFFRHLKTVFEDETRQNIELKLKTAKGDEFHALLNSVLRRDAQGRALCWTSFIDVTTRREAEERLRESEEKYHALFTKMLDGVAYNRIILDEDGRPADFMFLEVNDAFERHTGLKREDVVGKRLTEVLPGTRESGFDWIGELGRVALTGNELRTEQYFEPLGRWYAVSAYSPERGYLNVVFEDVTERKEAEEQLRALLREKEILLKELNHRVKNNMHVVSGLLALQSAALSDERTLTMFSETQDRIRSISLVHERLQYSEDLSHINLGDYVKDLTDALLASHAVNPDAVSLDLDVDSVSVSIDTAVPCGLIINELLSNSFKYAFPDGRKGKIRISLHRTGKGRMELVAGDDGIGLPEGFDPGGTKTLGLKLVRQLAENQLRGSMELTSGTGTTCRVLFADSHRGEEGSPYREEDSHH
jgi:PAS domain S-box-containing protein